MTPRKLDHVALYVSRPWEMADRLTNELPFRIIEESDEFVLVGRDPQLGKLTLFVADGPREPGALDSVGIGIPGGMASRSLELGDGLRIDLVPTEADGEIELVQVALTVADPPASAQSWLAYGFEPASPASDGAVRVQLGDQYLELRRGSGSTERPLLNHLGVLVDSFDGARKTADERGFHVDKVVDAENSRALFVRAPDGVQLEYIEHKPSFALA